jgi:uncharacterized BrkB/YihY/UPF0761 family membrane protein
MQKQTQFTRFSIVSVGLLTIVLSMIAIFSAMPQVRAPGDDALFGAYVAILLLSVLLAAGGGWLVLRGIRYRSVR